MLCGVDNYDGNQGICDRLTESEQAQDYSLILPLFHQMTEQEQDYLIEALKSILLRNTSTK